MRCVCVCPLLQVCVCVHCSRCVCVCVSTAPGVCVCPLLQVCVCVCVHCSRCVCVSTAPGVCVCVSTAPGVCVCVCPLLQVCVCVCVCVSTAPGVCALGWVKYREHIPIMVKCLNIGKIIGKPIYQSISKKNPISIYVGRYSLRVYYSTVPIISMDTLAFRLSNHLTGTVYWIQNINVSMKSFFV